MIPLELRRLVEKQLGNVHRVNHGAAERALAALNIPPESEISEFFLTYVITLFTSSVSDECLCDIAEPTEEILVGTRFVHEVWGLPDRFVCLTNVQGEGGYLYDKETGKVWDFSLASREDFLAGRQIARWDSFFQFLSWYLGAGNMN